MVVVPQSVSVTSAESDTVAVREDKLFSVGSTHVFVTCAWAAPKVDGGQQLMAVGGWPKTLTG